MFDNVQKRQKVKIGLDHCALWMCFSTKYDDLPIFFSLEIISFLDSGMEIDWAWIAVCFCIALIVFIPIIFILSLCKRDSHTEIVINIKRNPKNRLRQEKNRRFEQGREILKLIYTQEDERMKWSRKIRWIRFLILQF